MTLTTKSAEEAAKDHFSVSYKNLPSMCEVGDTIFLGRYLVTGADESSLFMEARPPAPLPHPCPSPVPLLDMKLTRRSSHASVWCAKL